MGTTTPRWAVWKPTDDDPVAPLEGLFGELADSVEDALTLVQSKVSYSFASSGARDARYPGAAPLGTKIWREDTLTEEVYLNATYGGTAGWKPWNSVRRSYTPTFSNFSLGSGHSVAFRWWYENGSVHVMIAGTFGSGAGWNDPRFSVPVAAASWIDFGSANIGYGQLDNTEENPGGRYMLGGLLLDTNNIRLGAMNADGVTVLWAGLGAGTLGIDSGDRINGHFVFPAW